MNPVLNKLFFRGQSPVLVLDAPPEFKKNLKGFGSPIHTQPKGQYGFILIFVKSVSEGEKAAKVLKKAAAENGVLWVAYPKGSSLKYRSDYNRDTGHALMVDQGFNGVSLVSIDGDWSAMRFKVVQRDLK